MRASNGWFKAWRDAWGKDLSQNLTLWGVWNALLHMATWRESKILWAGTQRTLPPGSVVFGVTELASQWGTSKKTILKWLRYLHDTHRIVLESSPRGTLAIICNWEAYQAKQELEVSLREHGGNAEVTPGKPYEEVRKKNKEEESIGTAVAVASQSQALGLSGKEAKALAKADAAKKANRFAASYVKAYQTRFPGRRPEDLNDGKVRGQMLTWVKDYPLERACDLIQVYFQMDARWFETKGYDFLTFRNNLNKIGQALDSGMDPDGNAVNWSKVDLS